MAGGPQGRTPSALLEERMDAGARARLRPVEAAGLTLLSPVLPARFRAAFTTRLAGRSLPPYSSLNLASHVGDQPSLVAENRGRLLTSLEEFDGRKRGSLQLVSPQQVHGLRVVGASEYRAEQPGGGCDGLTLQPGLDDNLAALLLFADCLPVILVSEVDLAVVHSGWRGLLGGVIQQAARAMTAPPGLAFVGPSIGPCCYAVGDDLGEAFTRRFGSGVFEDGRLDLWEAASRALGEVAVQTARVVNPRLCTRCHHDLFFSYRAEGPVTGRHGLVAWLA